VGPKKTKLHLFGIIFISTVSLLFATDWSSKYQRLYTKIEKEFSEPKGDPPNLDVFLHWMEVKAKDRNEVRSLLEEAKSFSQKNPDDEVAKMWVKKFSELLSLAQSSGENTVNGAVLRFMRIRDPKFPQDANWQNVIWRLQNFGRQIYLKARETGFLTPDVKTAAKCMINFSIRDVEASPYGFGVYDGREGTFNIPKDRDFDVDCEPRSSFSYTSKGRPSKPTDLGLAWINQVREEARWWQFSDAVNDATELMEEFYEDSMCESPPNDCSKGHTYYRELAEKYKLDRGYKYNEGFYGTIYGHVDIVSSSGRRPAEDALVTVISPLDGQTWTAKTDDDGNYIINDVLLHKECKPFEITAVHKMGEAKSFFEGPLEKPNPSYRFEKNLEIKIAEFDLIAEYDSVFEESFLSEEKDGYWKKEGKFFAKIRSVYKLENISKTDNEIYEKYRLISCSLESFNGQRTYEAHYDYGNERMEGTGQALLINYRIQECGRSLGISYDASSGNVRRVDQGDISVSFDLDGQIVITWTYKNPPRKETTALKWDVAFPGEPQGFPAVDHHYMDEQVSGNIKSGLISGHGYTDYNIYKFDLRYRLKKEAKKQNKNFP